jgi:methylated-DNA-[protein]-cysteine S-methyltransferase
MQTLSYTTISSPVGNLILSASGKGLCGVWFENSDFAKRSQRMLAEGSLQEGSSHPLLRKAEQQLKEYFAGGRTAFDVKLDMRGTVFQIQAWRELQKIPYGKTISYGEQAARMGDAKKARAAGMANGRNPISIIVPCHRVIGASGALTGFGGGLSTKQYLLELEARHCS